MTDLPPGWEWTTLEDLLAAEPRAITDGPFGSKLASKHYTTHGARVIRLQNIGDGVFRDEHAYISSEYFEELRAHEVRAGDLLLASLGEVLPRACIVPDIGPAIVKADCIRARIHPDVDARWVLYALMSLKSRNHATSLIKGVGRPRLGLGAIKKLPVPLPPLAEQGRIVGAIEGYLSRLDFGATQLKKTLARIDGLRERIMEAACTGRLDVEHDGLFAKDPAATGVNDGELPTLPASWKWVRLGELAEVVGGITKDSKKQSDPNVPMVPYLRVANVQRGRLELSTLAYVRAPEEKVKKLSLQYGDVLLNEGGDRDKLGRGWIWENQIDRCIHQNHVFRARIHDGVLHPKLLAWHANGFGRRWFEANGKQSVNLASISLSKIKMFPVPVPPWELQKELVSAAEARLSVLDRGEALIRESLAWADSLRRSLLAEAFAGRLVPQDPTDVPASELLGRIRAERTEQPKTARARRTKPKTSPAATRTEWPDADCTPTTYEQEELL